jgi:multidrug efflux pump subunit AcrA (membrane-fusion protein)
MLVIAPLPLVAGCSEVEEGTETGYEPAKLEEVEGNDELKRVVFTVEGARRTGVQTTRVRRSGEHEVVPYAALIYDPQGKTYVYTASERLSFLREPVTVDRIKGDRVLVSDGPPAGTEVVTVGAAEVYGAELEIAASD